MYIVCLYSYILYTSQYRYAESVYGHWFEYSCRILIDLACLKFFYKYKNNHLPNYFLQCDFLKKYDARRPNLRVTKPSIFQNYITDDVNYRPLYIIPRNIKASSEKRLSIHLANLLNKNHFPKCIIEKIDSHSIYGVTEYFKKITIQSYNPFCQIVNCYICN